MTLEPHVAAVWVRRIILILAVGVVYWGFSAITFLRVAADDHSTPDIAAETLLITRPLPADEGELIAGSLYLATYLWPPEGDQTSLRLVRVVGIPGESVIRNATGLSIGGRPVSLPPEQTSHWPEKIPMDCCLVLTDQPFLAAPARLHPDSRILGPIAVEGIRFRVVATLPF